MIELAPPPPPKKSVKKEKKGVKKPPPPAAKKGKKGNAKEEEKKPPVENPIKTRILADLPQPFRGDNHDYRVEQLEEVDKLKESLA